MKNSIITLLQTQEMLLILRATDILLKPSNCSVEPLKEAETQQEHGLQMMPDC